jgi:hypothetical protein
MASELSLVEFVADQIDADCAVTYRKMFGEFALYSHGTLFALICDNRRFVKPTDASRMFIGQVIEAPAHPRRIRLVAGGTPGECQPRVIVARRRGGFLRSARPRTDTAVEMIVSALPTGHGGPARTSCPSVLPGRRLRGGC